MYYIYILRSIVVKKSYIGYTNNVEKRLLEHNSGKSIYTRKYRPWRIIYVEDFLNETDAILREKYLKSRAGRKKMKEINSKRVFFFIESYFNRA